MPLKIQIVDENDQLVAISDQSGLFVSVLPDPPRVTQRVRPFRQYLTLNGAASGGYDMRVNGETTPMEFYVSASGTHDRYITTLSFLVCDASATLRKFGNLTALTNGCKLYYRKQLGELIVLHEGFKSNWELIRLCLGTPAFGSAADSFRASNVIGNAEGYIPVLNLLSLGMPYGIKMDAGTAQRLSLLIQDDLSSGMDAFDCIVYGFEREIT